MNRKRFSLIQQFIARPALESGISALAEIPIGSAEKAQPRSSSQAVFKRAYDLLFSAVGLLLLSPVLGLIAIVIKVMDGGAVFYRQTRTGQFGRPFQIWKFRTMVPDADKRGPAVTGEGDSRITPLGRLLRRTKLDELPQLWNVLRGEMSLVGPRPEVPRYTRHYTKEQRAILQHKPGITDLASLRFRNEESLLQGSETMETFYVEQCLPRKLKLNQEYARRANVLTDTWIILQTICPYWVGVLAVYGLILAASFLFSYALLYDFSLSESAWHMALNQMPLVLGLQLGCLLTRRQCKGLLCFFGTQELRQVFIGLGLSCLLLVGLWGFGFSTPARNVILLDFSISLLFLGGFRVLLRLWRERAEGREMESDTVPKRVAIIGAGTLGAHLARSFTADRRLGRTAVAFFDDDVAKWHKHIHDIPVLGMPECLLQGDTGKFDEVAIAMPEATAERLEQLVALFEKRNLQVYNLSWPGFCRQQVQTAGISSS